MQNVKPYKSDMSLEFYLTFLLKKLTVFTRFRFRNRELPVEAGIYKNISRSETVCVNCTQSEIGDEFQYIFDCPFADQRLEILSRLPIGIPPPQFRSMMNDKPILRIFFIFYEDYFIKCEMKKPCKLCFD